MLPVASRVPAGEVLVHVPGMMGLGFGSGRMSVVRFVGSRQESSSWGSRRGNGLGWVAVRVVVGISRVFKSSIEIHSIRSYDQHRHKQK